MSNDNMVNRCLRLLTKIGMMVMDGKRSAVRVADTLQKIVDEPNLFGEPTFTPRDWREENRVIYFAVTSNGATGEEWIARLEAKGFRLSDYAKSVLRSKDFKPTSGVTTEVAVLKGMLFRDRDRVTSKIREVAKRRGYSAPNAEIACLIREKFSDEEIEAMGLWYIVAMHEPIKDSGGDPRLLSALRDAFGRWLGAYNDGPGDQWSRDNGFAFAASQVSA